MTDGQAEAIDSEFLGALIEDDPEELYQNAPCAYLSTLPDGTVAKLNQTFTRWTGHQPSGVVGVRRIQDLMPPGSRIHYETHLAPLLRLQGRLREIATEVVCADGSRLPVILNAVATESEPGQLSAYRIVLFDARERRRYEQELLAALRRAEESEARARQLAETLQATFLPPELLQIPGLDVAGVYRPAGDGSEVGGDFYDVFETGRGSYGILLGDVSGKGAAAATVTAVTRYTLRAEAARTSSPADALRATHAAVLNTQPDRFCTALFILLQRQPQGFGLAMASAGHHLPLLRRDGSVVPVGVTGGILGLIDSAPVQDTGLNLVPGDVLVLFTDGVTEARRSGVFFGEEGLAALLRSSTADSARELADEILVEVLGLQDGRPRDDIAVVVVKVPPPEEAE